MKPENITYQLFPSHNLIVAKASGMIDFADIGKFISSVGSEPDFEMGMNLLYDGREVLGMNGNPEAYQQAADMISDPQKITKKSKTVFLIKKREPALMAYIEGYKLMASASKVEHETFIESELDLILDYLELHDFPIQL